MEDMKTSYDTVTLGEYGRILSLFSEQGMDELERQVAVVAVLTGKTEDEVGDAPYTDYARWSRRLAFLSQEPASEGKPERHYRCGEYDLIPVTDAGAITTAQYIDYQGWLKKDRTNVAALLSCLLVPKGRTYGSGYDIAQVQQAIADHMTVTQAYSLLAFFLTSLKRSIKSSLFFSALKTAGLPLPLKVKTGILKEMARTWRNFSRGGAGSPASTPSARPAAARGTRYGQSPRSSSSASSRTPGTRPRNGRRR